MAGPVSSGLPLPIRKLMGPLPLRATRHVVSSPGACEQSKLLRAWGLGTPNQSEKEPVRVGREDQPNRFFAF